ncbi:MAG: glycosyltransferase family 2 protein, partial [Actinobacteria bacterium]|nr:glycosyltransferase family 2 protein [Actinomycetota bacterium]
MFIHDDAALERGAVEHMVARALADDSTAVVGPKIVSWDDPLRLEEVGMAVDRFGYPYKGLEKGEIDLGQYDNSFEVFFVTSTCMLVRHEVFRSLRGWDSQMRAFSEDLDLCWRARVMGHTVRVEPKAKARHAIALATGQRSSQFTPTRYYIRRNRLRTVAKNVSTVRLFWLIPQFVLLAIAEMIGFIVLRQYGEIVNIARALGWNLLRLPQTLVARARVQRARAVPDRKLSRLTVKEGTRVRAYAGHQTERLEEAWGRRAELIAERTGQVRAARKRVTTVPVVVAGLMVLALLVGFRNYLWSGEASVGTLLPYPDSPFALVRAYLSPWRETGLGQPWPPSPGLLFLGAFPMLALGAVGVAQKLLLVVLGAAAFFGAYRLVAELVGRPGRWVAGAVYLFGVVGLAGVQAGAMGALVFGAAAPYVLRSLLHTTGWIRPARYDAGAEIARIAIGTAVAAAFVPGAAFVFAGAGVLLAASRALLSASSPVTGLGTVAAGTLLGWALLLPWSWTWFATGGPLSELAGGEGGATQALAFNEVGMLERLLGASSEPPLFFALAPVVLGVVAVGVGLGQRRRVALALWLLVVCSGLFASAGARGLVPALLGSPVEAAVLPAVCLAALAGIAVGAMKLDLPRRGLGLWQPLAFGGASLAALLFTAGMLPALYHGDWEPGRGTDHVSGPELDQVHAVLAAEAEENGAFRTLWLGETWRGGGAPGSESARGPVVTGAEGRSLADLFQSDVGPAMIALERTLSAVAGGATDGAGRLLATFNVRYVVLERAPGVGRWLEQRDLGVA